MNYKELLKQLPTSWDEVKLPTYQRIINHKFDFSSDPTDEYYYLQEMDNSLIMLSAVLEVSIDDLRALPVTESIELIKAIQWLATPLAPSKIKPDYLIDKLEITTDSMLTYKAIESQSYDLDNIQMVIKFFTKKPTKIKRNISNLWKFWKKDVKELQASEMSMPQVMTLFFFAHKLLAKCLKRMRLKQVVQLKLALIQKKHQPSL